MSSTKYCACFNVASLLQEFKYWRSKFLIAVCVGDTFVWAGLTAWIIQNEFEMLFQFLLQQLKWKAIFQIVQNSYFLLSPICSNYMTDVCTLLTPTVRCIIYTSHTFPVVIVISPQLTSIFPHKSHALHCDVVTDWLRKLTDWPVSPRFDMMTWNEWMNCRY